jgi:hypothetical protein
MTTITNVTTKTAQNEHVSATQSKIFRGGNSAVLFGAGRVLFGLMATLASASAQYNFCIPATVPQTPDATMTIGKTAQGNYWDYRSSNGTAYSLKCDPYYTVDIKLPGSYNAGGLTAVVLVGGFDSSDQFTQANCPSASLSMLIYKRSSPDGISVGSWKLVNSQNVKGMWETDPDSQARCALASPYKVVSSGSSVGYDEYWVKVLPKFNGTAMAAGVLWEWAVGK